MNENAVENVRRQIVFECVLRKEFEMRNREAVRSYRTMLSVLLLCIMVTIPCACVISPAQSRLSALPSGTETAVPLPPTPDTPMIPTQTAESIPVTSLEDLSITGCPDWDVNKMYEYGEYLYGRTCAGCHGRQGQGVPFTYHFPALNGSTLAVSEDISHSLHFMMNTNIHPHASTLFEKDALAVINYIRITSAGNTDLICPGEYVIEINP